MFITETFDRKRDSFVWVILRIRARSFKIQNTSATLNVIHTCCPESCPSFNHFWFLIMFGWKIAAFSFSWKFIFVNFVSCVEESAIFTTVLDLLCMWFSQKYFYYFCLEIYTKTIKVAINWGVQKNYKSERWLLKNQESV